MKKIVLSLAVVILGVPSIANAKTDFSRCYTELDGSALPYALDSSGHLFRPPHDPSLSYYKDKGTYEVAVTKVRGTLYPSGEGKIISVLRKAGGEPSESVVTIEDAKDKNAFFESSTLKYAYQGNKCYVSEMSAKRQDPQTKKVTDQVLYNKHFCDQILPLAQDLTNSQLQKCGNVLGAIRMYQTAFQAKLAKQGRELGQGEMGFAIPYSPSDLSPIKDFSPLTVISDCKMNRHFYPVNGIASSVKPMGFFGGIIGTAPGPYPMNSKGVKGGGYPGTSSGVGE